MYIVFFHPTFLTDLSSLAGDFKRGLRAASDNIPLLCECDALEILVLK